MLSSFKQQGHMQITPDNLREKFNELGSSYQNSWKAFRKNVIDKAKEELLQLYKENRCELYFEYQLSPWDYAAASLIVEEAGGTLSALDGSSLPLTHPSGVLAANSEQNLQRLQGIVKRHLNAER